MNGWALVIVLFLAGNVFALSQVAPYNQTSETITGNHIFDAYDYRITQDTNITQITLGASDVNSLILDIYRGGLLVEQSSNLASLIDGNTIVLPETICVKVGDVFGIETDGTVTTPINLFGLNPDIILIGDSIVQGVPVNYAYTQTDSTTNILSEYWGSIFTHDMNWSYQNMGHGSDTTNQLMARYNKDVIQKKPAYVLIEGGLNDLHLGTNDRNGITFNFKSMIQQAIDTNIVPIYLPIICNTSSYLNNSQMQVRDAINSDVNAFIFGKGIYLKNSLTDLCDTKWSVKSEYSADWVHLNSAGQLALANSISNELMLDLNLKTIDVNVPNSNVPIVIEPPTPPSKRSYGGGSGYSPIVNNPITITKAKPLIVCFDDYQVPFVKPIKHTCENIIGLMFKVM